MTEVGGTLVRSDCSFFVSGDGCDVIIEGGKHLVTEVVHHVGDICLGEYTGLLQVAVGDVPIWIVSGDDASLDVRREGCTPQDGGLAISEEDPAHAGLCGIS